MLIQEYPPVNSKVPKKEVTRRVISNSSEDKPDKVNKSGDKVEAKATIT
jgi:hypothetical protein